MAEAVVVSPAEMRVIAGNNYGERIAFWENVPRRICNAGLYQLARDNDTPWALCRACHEHIRRFAIDRRKNNFDEVCHDSPVGRVADIAHVHWSTTVFGAAMRLLVGIILIGAALLLVAVVPLNRLGVFPGAEPASGSAALVMLAIGGCMALLGWCFLATGARKRRMGIDPRIYLRAGLGGIVASVPDGGAAPWSWHYSLKTVCVPWSTVKAIKMNLQDPRWVGRPPECLIEADNDVSHGFDVHYFWEPHSRIRENIWLASAGFPIPRD
jgi:uncharacterized SAM-binding protein YcdF (DUF218 family)